MLAKDWNTHTMLARLNPRQRKALELMEKSNRIGSVEGMVTVALANLEDCVVLTPEEFDEVNAYRRLMARSVA